eukprot:798602-Alexandrium_andersonii.AAC.1
MRGLQAQEALGHEADAVGVPGHAAALGHNAETRTWDTKQHETWVMKLTMRGPVSTRSPGM